MQKINWQFVAINGVCIGYGSYNLMRNIVAINTVHCTGADPEILHGRWLTGWLPIVNYTGARGVAG